MKTLFIIIFGFLPLAVFSQYINPDRFKSSEKLGLKSNIDHYYNPLFDNYDIHFVKLDLEVSHTTTYISGNALIKATVVNKLDTLVFDLHQNMVIDSVFINGEEVSVNHINHEVKYIFDLPLNSGNNLVAKIYYHGTPSEEGRGVSNAYSTEWGKNVTWTLSESFHAYEWWPCKQVLSDKIDSTHIYLTCDSKCKAGSNGLLINEIDLPGDKKRFEWETYYPINYYLISFAVSEYQDYSIYAHPYESDSILIQNYIYDAQNCLAHYKAEIDNTIDFIELFSEKFGLYPFAREKYGHCLTQLGGGMEHQTMTTIGNFGYTLVAHELGHMWFGDYVTCASWQDIWINEGFASYTEYVALENLLNSSEAREWMLYTHELAMQEPYGSVYIPFEDALNESRIFDFSLSYKKGAAILHMIRHEINNDELFFSIIRGYLDQFANGVATGDDFKNYLELNSDMDFDPFFDQWYYGQGFPRFKIEYAQANDTLILTVAESTSSDETPLFQLHVDYKVSFTSGDTTLRLFQSKNNELFKIPLKKKIINVEIDPNNWILNEEGTIDSIGEPGNNSELFSIFPNPSLDDLTLSFNLNLIGEEKLIKIFDLQGRLLHTIKSKENIIPVNLDFLSKGMYVVKASSLGNSFSYKFIKQ